MTYLKAVRVKGGEVNIHVVLTCKGWVEPKAKVILTAAAFPTTAVLLATKDVR